MSRTQLIPQRIYTEDNGSVVVFEEGTVPFSVQRTFVVTAALNQVRGNHAHKTCKQLLAVISGTVLVAVDDGTEKFEYELYAKGDALLLPPMHWATQKYTSEGTILLVACDQTFDEDDYLRDYSDFEAMIISSRVH